MPHAPCTPVCITNAPMASTASEPPKAQAGMMAKLSARAAIMLRLRPQASEKWPKTIDPRTAPRLYRIAI